MDKRYKRSFPMYTHANSCLIINLRIFVNISRYIKLYRIIKYGHNGTKPLKTAVVVLIILGNLVANIIPK